MGLAVSAGCVLLELLVEKDRLKGFAAGISDRGIDFAAPGMGGREGVVVRERCSDLGRIYLPTITGISLRAIMLRPGRIHPPPTPEHRDIDACQPGGYICLWP